MKISIIVPVYNEKDTIREILKKIEQVSLDKEIIVVDDGSSDGTKDILEKIREHDLTILYNKINRGKGYAIRKGIEHVKGDIVLIQDADLEYNPNDYAALVEPIISGRADVVYGSRWLKHGLNNAPVNLFRFGRWFLTVLTNLLYGIKITDEPCCYKVFKTKVIKNIPLVCERFEFCPEVTAKLSRRGYKICEVPVSYRPRTFQEGKKIRFRDGLEAVATLLKYRFWK
jgi:glycosyltransferase involved in cell wall biosynthesis